MLPAGTAAPEHTTTLAGAEILGLEPIETLTVATPEHPAAVPVTVYVVFVAGVTLTGEPLKLPGIHVYVVPATELVADNEEELPPQIEEGAAVGVITGLGFTVTVTVLVPIHPAEVPVTV